MGRDYAQETEQRRLRAYKVEETVRTTNLFLASYLKFRGYSYTIAHDAKGWMEWVFQGIGVKEETEDYWNSDYAKWHKVYIQMRGVLRELKSQGGKSEEDNSSDGQQRIYRHSSR